MYFLFIKSKDCCPIMIFTTVLVSCNATRSFDLFLFFAYFFCFLFVFSFVLNFFLLLLLFFLFSFFPLNFLM